MHSQSLVGTKVSAVVMRKMTSIPDKENSKRTFRDTLRVRGGKRRGRNNWKSEWKSTDGEEQMQSRKDGDCYVSQMAFLLNEVVLISEGESMKD